VRTEPNRKYRTTLDFFKGDTAKYP